MAKSRERNLALKFRKNGKSIKDIAKELGVAKSTVSLWCRDVFLNKVQLFKLHEKMIRGGHEGRLKGAKMQYERRLEREKKFKTRGFKRIGRLSKREFLIAGIALYWGEGQKKGREVRITNSDPELIKFIIDWFKRGWGVTNDRFTAFIIINKIHEKRLGEVENYWSRIANIPKRQFTKTILVKRENKKNYSNFPTHYGTLTIRIKKPASLHYQIIGSIEGLTQKKY
jgi:transcriptional regulator with XRE-family HTH domain